MSRKADKMPSLGLPSEAGPCLVVQRIEDEVRSQRVREHLQDKVEDNKPLSNSEAHTVYDKEVERVDRGLIKRFILTAHAQYRMDLRGISVPLLRIVFKAWSKQLNDWKSQKDPMYEYTMRLVRMGDKIEYLYKKLDLFVVFAVVGRETAEVVTVYWKGESDPKATGYCRVPHSHKHGYRKPIEEWTPQSYRKEPAENSRKDENQEKQQVLPSPPWKKQKPAPQQSFNGPGWSGTSPDGRSLHQDKVRTVGVPGGDHPHAPYRTRPVRRPGVVAGEECAGWFDRVTPQPTEQTPLEENVPANPVVGEEDLQVEAAFRGKLYPSSSERQRKQKGKARRKDRLRYKRKRGEFRRRAKKWYRRYRANARLKKDKARRIQSPKRFLRRPGGGTRDHAQRMREFRKNKKKASLDIPMFFLPTQEWGYFIGMQGDSACLEVGGFELLMPLDLMFDQFEGDSDSVENLFSYLDAYFEYVCDDAEEDMSDEMQKEAAMPKVRIRHRPKKRQKKQRGQKKWKSKMNALRNRAKNKIRNKKRYRIVKNLPTFKKQQKIRRKHPGRFRRRNGQVLTAPQIAFVIGGDMDLGYVRGISPMTGLVTYHRFSERTSDRLSDALESLQIEDFMESVVFLSEQDEDAMYRLIDVELGLQAWAYEVSSVGLQGAAALLGVDCDSEEFKAQCEALTGKTSLPEMDPSEVALINTQVVHELVYDEDVMDAAEPLDWDSAAEPTEADPYLIDPQDDDWYYGKVYLPEEYARSVGKVAEQWMSNCITGEMLRQVDSPKTDTENYYSRADDRKKRKEPKTPLEKKTPPSVEENPGSAKVIPWNNPDLINNRAASKVATLIGEIVGRCGEDLVGRAQGLNTKLRRVDQKNAVWLYDVQGSDKPYRVRVKLLRKGNRVDPQKLDVRVSCSCPFWQWQGPEHWAKVGDYLFGKPVGTASRPATKDPNGKHAACKHVLAVFDRISNSPMMVRRQKRGSVDYEAWGRSLVARYLSGQGGS